MREILEIKRLFQKLSFRTWSGTGLSSLGRIVQNNSENTGSHFLALLRTGSAMTVSGVTKIEPKKQREKNMKKFIIAITLALCATVVRAENETQIATSVGYVAEELETRQDKFNKLGADTAMTYSGTTDGAVGSRTITGDLGAETNTSATTLPTVGAVNTKVANKQDELNLPANTVLMDTGISGAPAAKGIYDDSGSYVEQTDSLIEAATFNAALQNAINSEFTCAQRKDPNDPTSKCLLFNIFAPTTNLIIPAEYTRLEYLESTGTQYIDTGVVPTLNSGVSVRASLVKRNSRGSDNVIFGATNEYVYANGSAFSIDVFTNQVALPHGGVNNSGYNGNWIDIPNMLEQVYEYKINYMDDGYAWVDNLSMKLSESNTITTLSLYLFGDNSVYGYSNQWAPDGLRIYDVVLTSGTSISHYYIPAKRNSDGVLGMYDTVTNTFYTNAGSGTFIAGPELSSNIYLPMN